MSVFLQDSVHDFEIGGDRMYFGTGGAAVQTLDLGNGRYRASRLRDHRPAYLDAAADREIGERYRILLEL